MGFWGIEVKPGNPYPYNKDNAPGKLRVTQATLGLGSSTEKSILQCSAGHKSPVFLCSLLPNKTECCSLDLEFDSDDLVAFSVIGSRSIHLSGYFVADDVVDHGDDYASDSYGEEDIADTETDESSEYDMEDDYADDFIDDSDIDVYLQSPVRNSGVIIEEIVDVDKPENGDGQSKKSKKKNQIASSMDRKNSQQQIVVKGDTGTPVLESEDEDGFPICMSDKGKSDSQKVEAELKDKKTEKTNKKKAQDDDNASNLKRKVENVDQDEQPEGKKKKKKKKSKEQGKGENYHLTDIDNETNVATGGEKHLEDVRASPDPKLVSQAEDELEGKLSKEKAEKKKKRQKKKKTQEHDGVTNANQTTTTMGNQNLTTLERGEKQTEAKASQVRTYGNGLVVEELSMGKPDGKRAAPGKQVSVTYIGKLRKDGKIFDSNVGRAPFKFRLGVGQVIKGWDVGIDGMRIGDKRRITIPPSMGYGDKRVGPIPQNSWLVFDVELVDVR